MALRPVRHTGERGNTAAEYLGLLAVVGVLVATLASSGLGGTVAGALRSALCTIVQQDCAGPAGGPGETEPQRRDRLTRDLAALAGATPVEVAAWFAALDARDAGAVAALPPRLVATLDGAPSDLRVAANQALIGEHIAALRRERDGLIAENPWLVEDGPGPGDELQRFHDDLHEVLEWWPYNEDLDQRVGLPEENPSRRQQLADLGARIGRYEAWLAEDRQILAFDPSGRGRVVEVLGGVAPEDADHVAVIVPGVWNELENYEAALRDQAVRLHAAAPPARPGERVATIAWLGYDAPVAALRPAAVTGDAADAGASALAPFLAGLEATAGRDRHLTVIGHSYGSLTTAEAVADGAPADDVVFIGSPGVRRDHVDEFATPARIWVGLTRDDDITAVPNVRVGSWGHGRDPYDPAFGARRFDVGPAAQGHVGYFDDAEARRRIGLIITGDGDTVPEPPP